MRDGARLIALTSLLAIAACYTYVPVESGTTPNGERIAFEISDQGRVGLAERIGPGIARIEGRLVGVEGEQYLVSVHRVETIRGESSAWSGETMRLDRGYVSHVRERHLSRGRTAIAAGAATAALVAIVMNTGLRGWFTGSDEPRPDPPPVDARAPLAAGVRPH